MTEISDQSGHLVERYEYDVYGAPTIFDSNDNPLIASAIGNPYLFTGRRYDPESGNYYYRARVYSPSLGRFLQTDPLGYVDGLNLYAYVGNNPMTYTDPYGLFAPAIPLGYVLVAGVVGTVGGVIASDADLREALAEEIQYALDAAKDDAAHLARMLGDVFAPRPGVPPLVPPRPVPTPGPASGNLQPFPPSPGSPGPEICPVPYPEPMVYPIPGNDPSLDPYLPGPKAEPLPPRVILVDSTEHGDLRKKQAQTDPHRNVGDVNRIKREATRIYVDNETGATIYYRKKGQLYIEGKGGDMSRFHITKKQMDKRVRTGRWTRIK